MNMNNQHSVFFLFYFCSRSVDEHFRKPKRIERTRVFVFVCFRSFFASLSPLPPAAFSPSFSFHPLCGTRPVDTRYQTAGLLTVYTHHTQQLFDISHRCKSMHKLTTTTKTPTNKNGNQAKVVAIICRFMNHKFQIANFIQCTCIQFSPYTHIYWYM